MAPWRWWPRGADTAGACRTAVVVAVAPCRSPACGSSLLRSRWAVSVVWCILFGVLCPLSDRACLGFCIHFQLCVCSVDAVAAGCTQETRALDEAPLLWQLHRLIICLQGTWKGQGPMVWLTTLLQTLQGARSEYLYHRRSSGTILSAWGHQPLAGRALPAFVHCACGAQCCGPGVHLWHNCDSDAWVTQASSDRSLRIDALQSAVFRCVC